MKKGAWFNILLVVILAMAGVFSLLHLNAESLWLDEGITYYNSSAEDLAGVWDQVTELDQSPPGYYFLMHGVLKLFGENEMVFRLVSVIFGVLSVWVLYLLMSNMFNRKVGIMAALLLAVNSFHIGFAMEARMYVLLSLEALVAFLFLYRAIWNKGNYWLNWGVFTLVSVMGLYTHNFYFFVLLGLVPGAVLMLLANKGRLRNLLVGAGSGLLMVLCYWPWLDSFRQQLAVERYWVAEVVIGDMKTYLLHFANESWILFGLLMGLSVLGFIVSILRWKKKDYWQQLSKMFALGLFCVVGLGAPLFYSLQFEPILKLRYMIYLVPIYMGLAAVGLMYIKRLHWIVVAALLGLMAYLNMPWAESRYPLEFGEDFRSVVELVKEDPDTLIIHSPSMTHVVNFYNAGAFETRPFPNSDDLSHYNIDETNLEEFAEYVSDLDSYYLLMGHPHEQPHGLLENFGRERCSEYEKVLSYNEDKSGGTDEIIKLFRFRGCLQ